jgi:hypothetical protein
LAKVFIHVSMGGLSPGVLLYIRVLPQMLRRQPLEQEVQGVNERMLLYTRGRTLERFEGV